MSRGEDWSILKKFESTSRKQQGLRQSKDAKGLLACLSIEHNGQEIRRLLTLAVPSNQPILLTIAFKSSQARWRQGLHVETEGSLEVAGMRSSKLLLWTDTAPPIVKILCRSVGGEVRIWNVWDTGSGSVDSLINCAGIIAVKQPDVSWELRCNDGYPDDDFDDVIANVKVDEIGKTVPGTEFRGQR